MVHASGLSWAARHPVPDDERIERERESRGERRARRTIGKCREVSITERDFCLFTSVFAGRVCGPSLVQPARADEVLGRG